MALSIYVDRDTGEELVREGFIQMYGSFFIASRKMLRIDFVLLFLIIERSNFNEMYIDKRVREELAIVLDVKQSCIANSLGRLVKLGILLNRRRGIYSISPKFFFRGSTKFRNYLVKNI